MLPRCHAFVTIDKCKLKMYVLGFTEREISRPLYWTWKLSVFHDDPPRSSCMTTQMKKSPEAGTVNSLLIDSAVLFEATPSLSSRNDTAVTAYQEIRIDSRLTISDVLGTS